jgi:AraC-like DNA-binding protein
VFKKETGLTFSDFLAQYRLRFAKKWLVETDMTILEIATRLKYANSTPFIRYFSKATGVTPGTYRKDHMQL